MLHTKQHYTMKFLSDIDYSYNNETGNFDIPAVQWETDFGTYWERFESEEARSIAIAENEAYNNRPEVKAEIEANEIAEDIWRAEMYTNEIFDHALSTNTTVALADVVSFANAYSKVMFNHVVKLVCLHNKFIMKTRVAPKKATFTIGDLL